MTKNLWIAAVIAALVGLLYFGPTRSYIMSKVPSVSLPSLSMPKMPWSKPDLPKEPDLSKIELPKVPDFVPEPEPEPEPAAEEAKPSWRDLVKIPPLPWPKKQVEPADPVKDYEDDTVSKPVKPKPRVDSRPPVKHNPPTRRDREREHCDTTVPLENPRDAFDRARCYGD
jgi:hypothetical protein